MTISKDSVVRFHYTMRNPQGEMLESTRDDNEAVTYLHGHGNLLPALEQALEGRQAGDQLTLTLSPEQAYGERQANATQRLSKKLFRDVGRFKVGDTVPLQTDHGPRLVTVLKIGHSVVDVDTNHPYAGQTLSFDVEIVEQRAATPEELEHGHAHGPGGHHH